MGQTAEVVGHLFGITREQSDAYAVESHKRLANAQAQGWLKGEVETAFARDGKFYDHDDGVRPDSSMETLAKLKPVFERPWGQVTAGNSSQITDGASLDHSRVRRSRQQTRPQAEGGDHRQPVVGARSLDHGARPGAVGDRTVEAQQAVAPRHRDLGTERSLRDAGARLPRGLGGREILPRGARPRRRGRAIDRAKLNVDGGAISLGHPVGTSGNRIVLHLVNAMKRLGTKRGIATECIGGGQGGAMLIEMV